MPDDSGTAAASTAFDPSKLERMPTRALGGPAPAAPPAATAAFDPSKLERMTGRADTGTFGAKPPATMTPHTAEMRPAESWTQWGLKRGEEAVGATLGGMAGTALEGGIPGPGTMAGAAAGIAGADLINKAVDDYISSGDVDVRNFPNAHQAAKDYMQNLEGTLGGEAVLKAAPALLSKFFSKMGGTSLEGAVDTGMGAKQSYMEGAETRAGAQQATAESKQADIIKGAEPGARQDIIRSDLGGTPKTAAAAVNPPLQQAPGGAIQEPSEEFLAKQKGLTGTYFSIKQDAAKDYGVRYAKTLEPYQTMPVKDISDTTKALYDQQAYQQDVKLTPYNTDFRRAVAITKNRFGLELTDEEQKFITDSKGKVFIGDGGELIPGRVGPGGGFISDRGTPLTISDTMALKRMWGRIANMSRDEATQKGAGLIEDSLSSDITKAGLPKEVKGQLGALDAKYRQYKLDFDQPTSLAVSKGQNPTEKAEAIFGNPQRFSRLWANANPAQKAELGDSFSNYMAENPDRLLTKNPAEAQVHADMFKQIAPNSPLANPKSIMYVSGKLENLASSPEAMRDVQESFQATGKELMRKGAIADRDAGLEELRKLGPVGQDTMRAVKAAASQGPEAQARIVDKFFGEMSPESLKKLIGEKQGLMGGPITAQMGAKPQFGSGPWMMRMISRPGVLPWFAGAAAMSTAMMGHPSPWYLMMAGGAGVMTLHRGMQTAVIKGLTSDYAAPIMSALTNGSTKVLGSNLAKATAATMGADFVKDIQGSKLDQPAEKPPPKMDIGPMSKDIERKQAIAISSKEKQGYESHLDHIQGLNKDIASGETPDVQHDLASGRISNQEVQKLVAGTPGKDFGAMFKGMSIPDAMDAFKKGTPDERELAFQPLIQKVNDEGRNLQPMQKKQLLAQLRAALAEQGESV